VPLRPLWRLLLDRIKALDYDRADTAIEEVMKYGELQRSKYARTRSADVIDPSAHRAKGTIERLEGHLPRPFSDVEEGKIHTA